MSAMHCSSVFLLLLFWGATLIRAEIQDTNISLPPVKLNTAIILIPVEARPLNDTIGVSNGVQQCGGSGQVVDWTIGDCDPAVPGPCAVKAERYDNPRLTFIASKSSESVNFKVAIAVVGEAGEPFAIKAKGINKGPVIKGGLYAVTAGVAHSSHLRGKVIHTTLTVYREEDGEDEICASVDWAIV